MDKNLAYLKMYHIQNDTLFMTNARDVVYTKHVLGLCLRAYPKGAFYYDTFNSNANLFKDYVVSGRDAKGNTIYKVKDLDGLIVSLDSIAEFSDFVIEKFSTLQKGMLASIRVWPQSPEVLFDRFKKFDQTLIESAMPNGGSMDEYIELIQGIKDAMSKPSKSPSDLNSDYNLPF